MRQAFFATALLTASATHAHSQEDWSAHVNAFVAYAQENKATEGGVWLETRNAFGEWEKVILVFGYDDPGDEAVCFDILAYAAGQNAARLYRCNPVN